MARLQADADVWAAAPQTPVHTLFAHLAEQVASGQATVQSGHVEQARLDGERVAYVRLLAVVTRDTDHSDTVPCPICGKALRAGEREASLRDMQTRMEGIAGDLAAQDESLRDARAVLQRREAQVECLRELRNALAHVQFESVSPDATLAELQEALQSLEAG